MSNLNKKALYLSYITVSYNLIEGIVSIIAGGLANSIALVGFGLDSFVESISGLIMIWRFSQSKSLSKEQEEKIEKKAIKLVGYSFFILSAYILFESGEKLFFQEIPNPSLFGIIIAIVSLITMPTLFIIKYKTGKKLNSKSLMADSKQTLACMFLSFALLIGLSANYLWGFWQADPIVGLIIVVFLIREGIKTIKESKLCTC